MKKKALPFGIDTAVRIMREAFSDVFRTAEEDETAMERAVSMEGVYSQVWNALLTRDGFSYPWLNNLYWDEGGQMFCVVSDQGKLYRADLQLSGSDVTVGEFMEVVEEFRPATRSRFTICRQKDGSIRWFLVSGTSVLNRNGEIDSKKLYDNLSKRASDTGKYPYLTYYHLGKAFEMGTVDLLDRDTHVGIASGLFHDNEVARAMIVAYEKDPEYWGASISYWPLENPVMREIADGISIPVYEDGEYEEISILPESDACSLFTALVSGATTEDRKVNKRLEDALRKLGGDNTELVDKFIHAVDETNTTIEERQLITRSADETPAPGTPVVPEATTPVVETPTTPEAPVTRESQPEFVLDDTAVKAITDAILASEVMRSAIASASRVEGIVASMETLSQSVAKLQNTVETDLNSRVATLEQPLEQNIQHVIDDLPRKRTVISYRASQNSDPEDKTPQVERKNLAATADETIARMGLQS